MATPRSPLSALLILLVACGSGATGAPTTASPTSEPATPVRNVILVIGDGMGPAQVALLEEYARRAPSRPLGDAPTAFERMAAAGDVGLSMTGPVDALVVDSACSATQLSTGIPSRSEVIGVAPDGETAQTVLELAKERGMLTGLVSDTRMTHATPASFAAHEPHRSRENEIAVDMLEDRVDVLFSGGLRHWVPASVNEAGTPAAEALAARLDGAYTVRSKRHDERDLLAEAEAAGYSVALDRAGLQTAELPALGLFSPSGMLDAVHDLSSRNDEARREPSLPEMTTRALELLGGGDQGFFLMVEAGQVDWACHANDAGWLLKEMLKANETLNVILDWMAERDDTLLVVTADHETGGFGFSYSRRDVPGPQQLPGFEEIPYQPRSNFGPLTNLDLLFEQDAPLGQIWDEFAALPEDEQTDARLAEMVNAHSAFHIDAERAAHIRATVPNRYHVEGHPELQHEDWPAFGEFEEFYVSYGLGRSQLMGHALGPYQNIVWSTGTHTHTPVPVFAVGAERLREQFGTLLHHTRIGQLLKAAVREASPPR